MHTNMTFCYNMRYARSWISFFYHNSRFKFVCLAFWCSFNTFRPTHHRKWILTPRHRSHQKGNWRITEPSKIGNHKKPLRAKRWTRGGSTFVSKLHHFTDIKIILFYIWLIDDSNVWRCDDDRNRIVFATLMDCLLKSKCRQVKCQFKTERKKKNIVSWLLLI